MCAGELDRVPEKLHHYMAAKGIADDYLRAGDLDFTIVKPGYLTHDPGCGKIKLAQNLGSLDQGKISREDVARAMVECLALDNTIGKGFEILAGETPIRKALEAV